MKRIDGHRVLVGLSIAMVVAACSGTQGSPSSSVGQPTSTAVPASTRPIDPTIEPVSRSNPPPEAKAALEGCQITDDAGLDRVVGMGLVPKVTDLPRYINLTGREPELNAGGGAWALVISGEVPQPMSGEVWLDPTCVVINGEQGWFATGGGYKILEGGERGPFIEPMKASPGPDLSLPPMAP